MKAGYYWVRFNEETEAEVAFLNKWGFWFTSESVPPPKFVGPRLKPPVKWRKVR